MNPSPEQLVLAVQLRDDARFDNYYAAPGSSSEHCLRALTSDIDSAFYIWGGPGVGVTHLLQAFCHHYSHRSSCYLPLSLFRHEEPREVLSGLDQLDVLGLDDIDHVVADRAWCEALFSLFNQLKERNIRFILGAKCSALDLDSPLADLKSRFSSLPHFRLPTLTDEQMVAAMQFRADQRGINLSTRVSEYLVRHHLRSMSEQMALFNLLDQVSLQEKSSISIPMIKRLFDDK